MRVIKAADTKNWTRQVECQKCTSVLEICASDLKFVPDTRDGDCYKFTCPECQNVCYIAGSLIPTRVQALIY